MVAVTELNAGAAPTTPEPLIAPGSGREGDLQLGPGRLAAFASPGLPIAALGLPLVVQLPEFYANVIGVKLAAVGLAFMIVRVLDVGLDPVLGVLIDRTHTRLGRFRPWIALGAPLLMLASYMIFMARPGVGAGYLTAWLLPLYAAFSILTLSHAAWAAVLAPGYNQRSRIYAWMQNGAVIGMLLVLLLIPVVGAMSHGVKGAGVRGMGWFVILLTPVTIGLQLWRTPEPALTRGEAPGSLRAILKRYAALAARPAVARILLAGLSIAMAPGISGAVFIFFFREARGFTTGQANLLLLAYFVGGLMGAPIWTYLARRIGKHRSMCAAALYYAGFLSVTLVLPKGVMSLGAAAMLLTGLAFSAGTIMLRAMMADAADEARLDQGSDSTAMLYAMMTSTDKIASALSIGLSFTILSAVGFVAKAGAPSPPEAILGLELLFVVGPMVFLLISIALLWGYRLDEPTHREIRARLEAQALDRPRSP